MTHNLGSIYYTDALRTIYSTEGIRGLYKGSLLALVGVSNGSIQFATYEAIKRRWTDAKRRLYEGQGRAWRVEDEKLVSQVIDHLIPPYDAC
jgi:solute carrier family 25 folate transporter 32